MNLLHNKNLQYFLCSCTNSIFGKIPIPEIWAKTFSTNQIAGFLISHISRTNQWNDFLHADANSHKLKVDEKTFYGRGQKWVWPFWSKVSKIGYISKTNWWNEQFFWMVKQIQESKKLFQWYLGRHGHKSTWSFSS